MIARHYSRVRPRRRRKWPWLVAGLAVVAFIGAGTWFALLKNDEKPKSHSQPTAQVAHKEPVAEPAKPPLVNLQPVVDAWVAKQKGDYGIVVYDPANQQTIATHQADKQFFTASIYKLYVVYLSLLDVDAGKHTLDEPFRAGKTRQTCLYDAIHTSDSPCAEALLAELGNDNVNERLKAFGLANTSFPSFVTSAGDVVKVLQRLQMRKELSQTSSDLMLGAMKDQVYRKGLPKGLPEATVYDKVGFSETPHYHDVGIIVLPDGREYIVAFLSQGVGSAVVADFGTTIYATLKGS